MTRKLFFFGKITNITKSEELHNDYIMCFHEAKDGTIWVGTDGGGIFVLKDKQIIKTRLARIILIINMKKSATTIVCRTSALV